MVSSPSVWAWCGAIAGVLAPLTIGLYVLWGGRNRRGYDPWRDTMTELADETDNVARWFVLANLIVAVLLGVFGVAFVSELDLERWVLFALLGASVNSVVIALTGCNRRCRYPLCAPGPAPWILRRLHQLAALINAIGIIGIPLAVSILLDGEADLIPLRFFGYPVTAFALVFAMLYVRDWRDRRDRTASHSVRVGLLERLLWIVGYAWAVVAAVSLLTRHWLAPSIAVAIWLAISLWVVLRPGWRDPSPEFIVSDCQPNTVYPARRMTCGVFMIRRITNAVGFADDLMAALDGGGDSGAPPLLRGSERFSEDQVLVTMGITAGGLRALDVPYRWNAPFVDDPFADGMQSRTDVLGDVGDSHPARWEEGWRDTDDLHIAFWIVARDEQLLHRAYRCVERSFPNTHLVLEQETTQPRNEQKRSIEHFGFVDGISAPWIERVPPDRPNAGGGVLTRKGKWRPVALGEFVVGHVDETGDVFPVPDPREVFEGGTFMVVRKLAQDVEAFNRFTGADSCLPAQLVGRSTDGTPLIPPTDRDDELNDFKFGEDPEGQQCPVGAHIRRANPRDGLGFGTSLTARRRLLRRGMPYDGTQSKDPHAWKPGLLFIAYNVRIAEQFEFIQSQWLNTGIAFGLGTDPDVISGHWPPDERRWITVRDANGRLVRNELPRLVTVRGGEYFFVPSLPGLRALAQRAGARFCSSSMEDRAMIRL